MGRRTPPPPPPHGKGERDMWPCWAGCPFKATQKPGSAECSPSSCWCFCFTCWCCSCCSCAGLSLCVLQSLHSLGFRVVLDVVYNHTFASGPYSHNSVMDKIVPGYYHRRQEDGDICHSTCCNSEQQAGGRGGALMSSSYQGKAGQQVVCRGWLPSGIRLAPPMHHRPLVLAKQHWCLNV